MKPRVFRTILCFEEGTLKGEVSGGNWDSLTNCSLHQRYSFLRIYHCPGYLGHQAVLKMEGLAYVTLNKGTFLYWVCEAF